MPRQDRTADRRSAGRHATSHTTRRARDERGLGSTLQVLLGAFIGLVVLGAASTFYINASKGSTSTTTRTVAEARAVEALNRMGRDVGEALRVVEPKPDSVVVERTLAAGTRSNSISRVRYRVVDKADLSGNSQTADFAAEYPTGTDFLVREIDQNASPSFSPSGFDSSVDDIDVLAGGVDATQTKFTYFGRTGATATSATDVGRVDVRYVAGAKRGTVELSSSIAVGTASGTGGSGGTPPPVATAPVAVNDAASHVSQSNQNSTAMVMVLPNDTYGANPKVTGGSFSSSTGAGSANWNTDFVTFQVPQNFSGTMSTSYTLTDDTGLTDTATVTLSVSAPAAPAPAPVAVDDTVNLVRGGSSVTIDAALNDTVNGATFSLAASRPSGVTVTASGSSLTITVNGSFTGGTLTYTLTNTTGSSTATIALRAVDAVNDSTTLSRQSGNAGSIDVAVLANDLPNSASAASAQGVSVSAAASVTTTPGGASGVTVGTFNTSTGAFPVSVSAASTATQVTFTYTLTQAGGSSAGQTPTVTDTASVTVTINTTTTPPPTTPITTNAFANSPGSNIVAWKGGPGSGYSLTRTIGGSTTTLCSNCTAASPPAGLSGSFTNSFTDSSAPLGSTATYTVAASGSTSGADTVLQFPPSPTTRAIGSDSNADRVADRTGKNTVSWNTVTGAADYAVREWVSTSSGNPSTATAEQVVGAPGTTDCASGYSPCWVDTGLATGTERTYAVLALNQCDVEPGVSATSKTTIGGTAFCTSPNTAAPVYPSSAAQRAYQVPGAAPTSVSAGNATSDSCPDKAESASNGVYNCDTGSATVAYNAVGDDNAPTGGKFCSFSNNPCFSLLDYATGTDVQGAIGAASRTVVATAPGVTDTIAVKACNPGGCTAGTNATLMSYPGSVTMSLDQVDTKPAKALNVWRQGDPGEESANDCWGSASAACYDNQTAQLGFDWTASAGATSYGWSATWQSGTNLSGISNPAGSTNTTALTSGAFNARPASVYLATVSARATNGLIRPVRASLLTNSSSYGFLQGGIFCNVSDKTVWRFGFARDGMSYAKNDATTTNQGAAASYTAIPASSIGSITYGWWVGKTPSTMSGTTLSQRIRQAAQMGASNTGTWASSWTATPNDSSPGSGGTEYWSGGISASGAGSTTSSTLLVGSGTQRLPASARTAAGVAVRFTAAGTPVSGTGAMVGQGSGAFNVMQYTRSTTGDFTCNANNGNLFAGTQWYVAETDNAYLKRHAAPPEGSSRFVTSNSTLGTFTRWSGGL
ncbi:hypothetical protein ASF47_19295 [Nocardioides sp. Leaf285]|nr:hypothetical protein ASF47_19295 [Nocardioides sp. Leaf285]